MPMIEKLSVPAVNASEMDTGYPYMLAGEANFNTPRRVYFRIEDVAAIEHVRAIILAENEADEQQAQVTIIPGNTRMLPLKLKTPAVFTIKQE